MKKWLGILISGALVIAVVSACVSMGYCQTPTQVSLISPERVRSGEAFWVEVRVDSVKDFDAANYDITYNPDVIEVIGVTSGVIGGTAIPVDMWGFIPTGVQGTVRLINNVPNVPGVSGSGYLAKIQFRAIGSCGSTTDIILHNGILGNNLAQEIEADWFSDSVSVYIIGDANEDCVVDASDITTAERMMLCLIPESKGADANEDGLVTALDLTTIERIILALS